MRTYFPKSHSHVNKHITGTAYTRIFYFFNKFEIHTTHIETNVTLKQQTLEDSQLDSCGDNVIMSLSVHNGAGGGYLHNEISWTLYEDNVIYLSGFAPYDGVLCFDESSTYKFDMHDSWVGHFFFSVPLSLIHSLTLSHRVRGSPCILPEHLNNVGRRLA